MKAVCWKPTGNIEIHNVPDPGIVDARDGVVRAARVITPWPRQIREKFAA